MRNDSLFRGFLRDCWTVWVPLVALMVLITCLFFTGHRSTARFISPVGTIVVMLGNLLYLLWRSKRRRMARSQSGRTP